MIPRVADLAILFLCGLPLSNAYVLFAKGMGMAKPQKRKKKSCTPFNVGASLLKLEKEYDKLVLAQAKAMAKEDEEQSIWEYVIAAKAQQKDWVPIAQICLESPDEPSEILRNQAVSGVCREISALAISGAKHFQSVPRDQISYSLESTESFYKFVYEPLLEGKKEHMSKSTAREILGVTSSDDVATIKSVYRKLSMQWHPDRHDEGSKEEASLKFQQVRDAYERLHVTTDSWYESLGGKERTEFCSIFLTPKSRAIPCGLVALDPELVQTFAARSLSSSSVR